MRDGNEFRDPNYSELVTNQEKLVPYLKPTQVEKQ